jgi:hypothetical protein
MDDIEEPNNDEPIVIERNKKIVSQTTNVAINTCS